jgi:hypothetical protein
LTDDQKLLPSYNGSQAAFIKKINDKVFQIGLSKTALMLNMGEAPTWITEKTEIPLKIPPFQAIYLNL